MAQKLQALDQVIDVSGWASEDNYSPYPEGARAKTAYICPESVDVEYPFLIPKHKYLFKESNPNYPDQYWVEIIAYMIGEHTGVAVPPAFVSYDSLHMKCGALIEWFYDRPSEACINSFFAGGHYMTLLIPHYDSKKGTKHNFRTVELLSRVLSKEHMLEDSFIHYWGKVFIFDALIGNTDRHQDNWGLVWRNSRNKDGLIGESVAKFSPAFDNGTAMGHEILERNLSKFKDIDFIKRYVAKGCHHMKWTLSDTKPLNFQEFTVRFLEKYPESRDTMLRVLSFDMDVVVEDIVKLTKFDVITPLSEGRASFICKLLRYRHKQLTELIQA
ncbi:hypothetical protein MNBD_BACTEROID06-1682 [hydrothermal vent metagenome]|uniref:HipA-like C-terminal domain-containing protein n=1 Tax=hydrothermal vent metagenome TaxID=652676 RepID=A0A3B0UTA6_9ZZZZ